MPSRLMAAGALGTVAYSSLRVLGQPNAVPDLDASGFQLCSGRRTAAPAVSSATQRDCIPRP